MKVSVLRHTLAESWSVAASGPGRSLLAAGLISLSIYLPGLLLLLAHNVSRLSGGIDLSAQLVATLAPGAEPRAIARALSARPDVRQVRIVWPEAARARFERTFPDLKGIVGTLGDVAFPVTLEIAIPAGDGRARALVASAVRRTDGIEQVEDESEIAERYRDLMSIAHGAAVALGGILIVAAMLSIASAVRLALDQHRDEVEIMRLMGATESAIRAPFWLYGLFAGLAGGLAAILLLAGTYGGAVLWLRQGSHPFLSLFWVRFFPPATWALYPLAGAVAGFAGAAASVRKERA